MTGRRRVQCPHCPKKFPTEGRMMAHKSAVHKGVTIDPVRDASDRRRDWPDTVLILLIGFCLGGATVGILRGITVQDAYRTVAGWVERLI